MKRAIHIVFWLSLAMAIAVVLLRKRKDDVPPPPPPRDPPKLAVQAVLPDARVDLPAPPDTAKAADRKAAPESETDILGKIRDNVRANPELALSLARQARQAFGDSAASDERDKLLVEALVNLEKIGAARDEAQYYYQHHPIGRYRQHLWTLTGARPDPPSGPTP